MKVCYIFRDPKQGGKSIEEIFKRISSFHVKNFQVEAVYYYYDSEKSLLNNVCRLRSIKADVYHNTGAVHFLNNYLWPKSTVLTVHDLGHFQHTLKGFRKFIYGIYNIYLPLLLSTKISVISAFTKQQLIATASFTEKKTIIIHNPYPLLFQPSPKQETGEVFEILQIGTGRNKNIDRLLKALSEIDCHLTIVGRLSPEIKKLLDASSVRYTSREDLSYDDVYELYCHADLVTFPSTFEGFGMPIVEANAVGRPIITSNLEPMLEIAGNAALFVDPYDVDDIRDAVGKLIETPGLYRQMVENGYENIKRFEIGRIAKQYFELYQTIFDEKTESK